MSGLLDDLATNWDFPNYLSPGIPSDHRDFSRPRQPFMQSKLPLDTNMADDISDKNILAIQKFLKTAPLGVYYLEEPDGKSNQTFLLAVQELQTQANKNYPSEHINLISNQIINLAGFKKLIDLLKTKIPTKPSNNITDFQKFFNLPETGILDANLIQKIKQIELEIAKNINDNSVIGMIYNTNTNQISTTLADVQEALELSKSNLLAKKSSNFKKLYKIIL